MITQLNFFSTALVMAALLYFASTLLPQAHSPDFQLVEVQRTVDLILQRLDRIEDILEVQ